MPKQRICPTHNKPLTYSPKLRKWYCPDCLYASYLTHQAQQEAQKRYRQKPQGKAAAKRYEQSVGGKERRKAYLKSDKYKRRRKEYNERLKESLRIAREAGVGRGERERFAESEE